MKKKFFVAALAATMFASAALGLAACSKDPATGGDLGGDIGGGGGGGGSGSAYTITLDANGGSFDGSSTKTVKTSDTGKIMRQPTAPTPPVDKIFYGWGLTKTTDDKITFPYSFDADTDTIYAIWHDAQGGGETSEYTITLDPDGGKFKNESGSPVTRTTTDKRLKQSQLTSDLEKDNYDFEGWYTEKNGGGTRITPSYEFSAAVTTIYANWTQGSEIGGGGGGGDISTAEYGKIDTTNKGNDCWLVVDTSNDWGNGYKCEWKDGEWQLTIKLKAGATIKFRRPFADNADYTHGGIDGINGTGGEESLTGHYGDYDDIKVNKDGTYTFYVKASEGNRALHIVEVWVEYTA